MPAVLDHPSAHELKKYAGQWVAIHNGKVLHSGDTPSKVAEWLRKHEKSADLVYRVPAKGEATTYFF